MVLSLIHIYYNGWYIVNFVSEEDALVSSRAVYRNVLLTGMLLIILTMAAVCAGFAVLRSCLLYTSFPSAAAKAVLTLTPKENRTEKLWHSARAL